MLRTLVPLLAAACALSGAQARKSTLDKAALEHYMRHLFVFDSQIKIEIQDPQPSEMQGFDKVVLRASRGPATQEFTVFVSKDGKQIVQGNVYNLTQNPFKNDLDKIKTEGAPSFGTPGATVVIVEFSDYQCPFCKDEAMMLRQNLLTAYPKQVRVYFKDFPLEQIHDWAKPAAIAGRCVFRQDPAAYWKFHDWIFPKQAEITAANLKDKVLEWAKTEGGIDGLQLGRCMDTKATAAEVDRTVAEARVLNVNSTPTLFINGRRIQEKVDWPTLRAIIDNEIEYQKTAKNAGEDCGCELKLNVPSAPPAAPQIAPGLRKK